MGKTVIVSGIRTPFGKFGGGLSALSAAQLGGIAIKEALVRANMNAKHVDEVVFGTVLQGGQGQLPSRQAAREAGIPWETKTETINKVCASGMRSVTLGDQIIRAGDADVIVAGGMESMSNAPYILPKARWGLRMGDSTVKDLMVYDGLTCSFTGVHMGIYGSETAKELGITREEQDRWAYRSHQLAIAAIESGKFAEEIVPVSIPQRKGEPITVAVDESPRKDTSLEKLAKLAPVFDPTGTITAGNAPGVNDGAAALVLMSEERAQKEGLTPLATIVAHTAIAIEAKDFPKTPGIVINELLRKTGKTVNDIDLFEINEAFATVALASMKIADLPEEKVNVNGGAIALGHPIGASGARIMITLIHELKRRGGGLGIAAICSGGGQGDAIMIEVH
ncbi:acetyl-CoA C-acetyltransferase [Anoxybacillus sp. LAT_35]|uniref:acetyl-CoA C-acetyltransferase n=1 Tax=Anoxybacillus TaxID=150247 RepID=UPI001EDC90CF|nr:MULTISPECIES: acetyl-CoA C-acetyltransferase [Anoxybacillus]MCG5024812.1 acetyl-CoA C-acetyltransferase [Anoxybacillus flavithermus]MCG6198951.1 acetyl-CoA C-acetyltransferase [Anoxybacillus sp. LAT_38]MCG3084877.1 acetyl-CoA C-acetyltransferase [Anoxybacillus sp. LAT27]MCG6172559.1 acetyl-CoA C-acetyltransferase [Anoxybacillus sp. LAT_11]MCG6173121.1 acetyl-CoA C-acetyltransferase [Anoxybacillus sp. LAT_11]